MNGYLADTNTISEYAKPRPDPRVLQWLEQVDPDTVFVSVITLGELRLGIEGLPAGRRRDDLEAWLTTGLPQWFASNLLPVSKDTVYQWAKLTAMGRRSGAQIGTADGLIAATALKHDLTLLTRNVKDFTSTSVSILNLCDQR